MKQKLDILLKEAIISLILSIIVFLLSVVNWKLGFIVLVFQIYRVFDIILKDSSFYEDETKMYIMLLGTIVSIAIFIMMLWHKQKRKLGFLFFLFYRVISSLTPWHTPHNPPNSF